MDRLTGRTLGQYRILEQLGRGGMAEVYKAYQPSLDRYVAVKVMYPHLASDSSFVQRFEREARAVARLQHPNILQVFEFGIEDGYYYMVMPFIDGTTLKNRQIEYQGIVPPRETVRIITAMAEALDYAHAEGMVHRDIKSANIMINRNGAVFLTDFGIAKMLEGPQFTMAGSAVGTPEYMSPEQCLGDKVDGRSDIYSLGIVLYEMTTGRVPFTADTPYAVATAQLTRPLPLPRQVNPQIPEAVEKVILKALAKSADDRYQTAAEFAQAVRDMLPAWEADPSQRATRTPVPDQAAFAATEILSDSASAGVPTSFATEIGPAGPESSSTGQRGESPPSEPVIASTKTEVSPRSTVVDASGSPSTASREGSTGEAAGTPQTGSTAFTSTVKAFESVKERPEQAEMFAKIGLAAIGVLVMFCGSGLVLTGLVGSGLRYRVSALQASMVVCVVPGMVFLAAAGMLQFRAKGGRLTPVFLSSFALVGVAIFFLLFGSMLMIGGSLGVGLLCFFLGLLVFGVGGVIWFVERQKTAEPAVKELAKPIEPTVE